MEQDFNKKHWTNPCPKYDCRKEACKCGLKFVSIPGVLGDDSDTSDVAPKNGAYCNAIVKYEANGAVYIYGQEGIPVLARDGMTQRCECNLTVVLPNGMTTYPSGYAPIRLDDALTALKNGRSIFLIDYGDDQDSVYTVSAVNANDGIWSMKVERVGINPYDEAGFWIVKSEGEADDWERVNFFHEVSDLDDATIWTFDTVADMRNETSLIEGYAKTLGYYSKGDGGGAFYKISSTQPSGYYEYLSIGRYAELILEADMDAHQFGAKGDGTTDDYNAISAMVSTCGYLHMSDGNYKTTQTLSIGQVKDINIKGTITYSGVNSAINFTGGSYLNVYIKSIVASNGECIKISPESSSLPFSFSRIYLGYGNAGSHTVELDGDEAAICNVFFDGIRWHSETTSPCHVAMTADANSSFINEIVFNNVNFWGSARSRAGVTVDNASNNEIQLKFDKANFENSWGIHTHGKVVDISLIDCRIGEIKDDSGWLTFDSYLPKVSIIGVGDNYLDLSNITLTNIASSAAPFLTTNLTIQDHDTTYLFDGGGVGFTDYIVPFVVPDVTKTYSSTGDITYSGLSLGGGLYNRFEFTGNGWVSFTLPTNLFYCTQNNVLVTTTYAISLTVVLSTGGSTTFITEANTTYLLKKIGNGIKYVKLS